eukprot:1158074-Pelagomonas_calceolata.AAC.6
MVACDTQRLVLRNAAVASEKELGWGRGAVRTALGLWAFDVARAFDAARWVLVFWTALCTGIANCFGTLGIKHIKVGVGVLYRFVYRYCWPLWDSGRSTSPGVPWRCFACGADYAGSLCSLAGYCFLGASEAAAKRHPQAQGSAVQAGCCCQGTSSGISVQQADFPKPYSMIWACRPTLV